MFTRLTHAFILLTFGAILSVGGFALGHYLGKPLLDRAKASATWPSVEGKIEISELITSHDHSHSHNRQHRNKNTYRQHVEYSYRVENQPLENHVVWFGDDYSSSSRSSHQAVVDRYRPGSIVKVYYEPGHPEISVLEPGAKFTSYVLYVVGWTLTIIGAMLVLGGLRTLISPV
jgi:Protein of unknown function (DUF3592)